MKINRVIAYLSPERLIKEIRDDMNNTRAYRLFLKTLERRALSEFSACKTSIGIKKLNYRDIPQMRLRYKGVADIQSPPRVVFVLLQFNHFEVTQEAIESINKLSQDIVEIVVVDNFSTDGSRSRLQEFADRQQNIHVVLSNENGGFAKGNNLGYEYAKRNLNPDFIVIANNDVIYPQYDFTRKIPEIYQATQFSILGPDIRVVGKETLHQNPMRFKLQTKKAALLSVEKRIRLLQKIDGSKLIMPSFFGRKKLEKKG